jgi:hypothetical protein
MSAGNFRRVNSFKQTFVPALSMPTVNPSLGMAFSNYGIPLYHTNETRMTARRHQAG